MIKIDHNVETNEITKIPLTGQELKDWEKATSEAVKVQAEYEAKRIADAEAKAALLARLGITESEAQLLLGGSN